jgi:hypothetical protein
MRCQRTGWRCPVLKPELHAKPALRVGLDWKNPMLKPELNAKPALGLDNPVLKPELHKLPAHGLEMSSAQA